MAAAKENGNITLKAWTELANVSEAQEHYVPSARFRDTPLTIRALSADEAAVFMKKSSEDVKVSKKGEISVKSLDANDYIIEKGIVEPDLKSSELQAALGTIGNPAATMRKMLRAGEYTLLLKKLNHLSGFDADINEEIEEVKNS